MATTFDPVAVATGLEFPEGPVAMPDGSVLFVQIKAGLLSRFRPETGKVETMADLGGGPNGVAIGPDGLAYVCNNGGVYAFFEFDLEGYDCKITSPAPGGPPPGFKGGMIQQVDLKTGVVKTLYTECEGKRLISPDDIVFDPDEGFWFTDCGAVYPDRIELGGVYYAKPDGSSITKAATIPTANGIGLSPCGDALYVSDTIFGRLWKLAIERPGSGKTKPGVIPGTPGDVVQTLPGYQLVDSLKVLQDGNVCVGTLALPQGGVTVFSTDGSGTTKKIDIYDPFVTNLCFAGEDMQDVWITAAGTGQLLKGRWPQPGLELAFPKKGAPRPLASG